MEIYCIPEFKEEYEKLIKKKSYKDLEDQLRGSFFKKGTGTGDLKRGNLLNRNHDRPFIKRRIAGSGGYRVYYLILPGEKVILGYVHPKKGKHGKENINDQFKAHLLKIIQEKIDAKEMYELRIEDGVLRFFELE